VDHAAIMRPSARERETGFVQRIPYWDAWGTPNSSYTWQPFGFAGGLYDSYPNTYRFGARDYDPVRRRWLTKDRARFAGGLNLYAYCANDPVNCVDPRGRGITLAGIIGGAAEFTLAEAVGGGVFVAGIAVYATILETERMDEETEQGLLATTPEEPDDTGAADAGDGSGADDVAQSDDDSNDDSSEDEVCKPKRNKGRRGRFRDPEEIVDQAESIAKQQEFERGQGRPHRIERTGKSEQRLNNALRNWDIDDE
jgi:RHS repeat-associated protein